MKWTFARNINNMGMDGIVDINNQTLLCLCHEEQSKIILAALESTPPEGKGYCQCSFAMIMRGEDDKPYCSECKLLIDESPASPPVKDDWVSVSPKEKCDELIKKHNGKKDYALIVAEEFLDSGKHWEDWTKDDIAYANFWESVIKEIKKCMI